MNSESALWRFHTCSWSEKQEIYDQSRLKYKNNNNNTTATSTHNDKSNNNNKRDNNKSNNDNNNDKITRTQSVTSTLWDLEHNLAS